MELNQITLPCVDYPASVEFYVRLGLTQIVDSPPHYARFETANGTTLSLHLVDARSQGAAATVYFEVEDVDRSVQDLSARGFQFRQQPVDQRWRWREAHLDDPAGNRICIYHAGENRRFPPWRLQSAAKPNAGS